MSKITLNKTNKRKLYTICVLINLYNYAKSNIILLNGCFAIC